MQYESYPAQANGAVTVGRVLKKTGVASNLPDVALATDGTIAGGEVIVGICRVAAADNAMTSVVKFGPFHEGVAGAAGIAAGTEFLTTDAAGELIAAVAGDVIVGRYLDGRAAAAGDRVGIFVSIEHWAVA